MKKLLLALMFVPLVSFGQTYSRKGRLEVEIVKPKKTRKEIQKEEIAARRKEAKDLKAELAAEQRAINRTKTDYKYYNSGLKKGKAEDYKGAINDLTKFISKYPKNPKGWSERGVYKTWLDDASAACFDFKRGAELGSEKAQKNLFKFCDDDGSVKKTIDDWLRQATEEIKLKNHSGTISSLDMVIKLWTPEYGIKKDELIMYRFNSKVMLKDYSGALSDVKMALLINPKGKNGGKTYTELIDLVEKNISASKSTMTKEKAIAKLKELKELLDLEVITQKDYDKEKAILSPIILGKN